MKTSIFFGLSLAAQAFTIVFYLYLARQTQPAAYGDTIAVINIALVVAGMMAFGANVYLIRELSTGSVRADEFLSRSVGRFGYVLVASVATGFAVRFIVPTGQVKLFVGSAVLVLLAHLSQLVLVLPLSRGKLTTAGMAQVADKATGISALIVLTEMGEFNANLAPWALGSGSLVSMFVVLVGLQRASKRTPLPLRPKGEFFKLNRVYIRNPWRGTSRIGVSSVCFGLQPADVTLVRVVAGAEVSGEYAAVSRWVQPSALMASVLGQSVLPKMASAPDLPSAAAHLRSLWPALVAIVSIAVGVVSMSGPMIDVVLGPEYHDSRFSLVVLMIATPLSFVGQLMYLLLTARGFERACSRIVVFATVVQFVLQIALSAALGSVGASMGFLALQVILVVLFGYLSLKAVNET